jgi:hypothetical protein
MNFACLSPSHASRWPQDYDHLSLSAVDRYEAH